jgi:hypothetical protein
VRLWLTEGDPARQASSIFESGPESKCVCISRLPYPYPRCERAQSNPTVAYFGHFLVAISGQVVSFLDISRLILRELDLILKLETSETDSGLIG